MQFFTPLPGEHVSLWKRAALLLLIIALIGTVAASALTFSSRARVSAVQAGMRVLGAELPADAHGRTNILLLGTGGEGHDGGDLTDTMIIASIEPHSRSAVMVSLPRDLFLDANRRLANGRINAVYANEKYRLMREGMEETEASGRAMAALAEEMGRKTGVDIHGVIKTDFIAFERTIDAIGGVDVDVPEAIIDYAYPVAENRVGTFSIDAGPQHLDGETALRYARSRHSTNDFDRSARQQLILSALARKIRSMGRLEQMTLAFSLFRELQGHVETTFTSDRLLGLGQIAAELSLDRLVSMQVNFYTGGDGIDAKAGGFVYPAPPELFEGASILLPVALPGRTSDWSQIQTFIAFLTRERGIYLRDPLFVLRPAGASRLQAYRLRNELARYGWRADFEFEEAEDGAETGESMLQYRDESYREDAVFMGRLLGLPVEKASDALRGSGDLLIFLGSSFTYAPFQTLSGAVLAPAQIAP